MTAVQVTDLGTLGGAQSGAADINDRGDVVGWSATAQGLRHAFLFSHGMMADVGSAFPGSDSEATGINTSGVVAGTMTDQFGTLAFVSPAIGNVTFLFPINNTVPLAPTRAAAINDSGQVCGDALFWSSPGSPMVIAGYADARDINASGVMVGIQDSVRARIWTQNICGKGSTAHLCGNDVPEPDPPTSYFGGHEALAINDHGSVVGNVTLTVGVPSPVSRGYFWDGVSSAAIDLGVLPNGTYSHADDINEYRFIAGHGDERVVKPPFFDVTHERAFLYHSDFGFYPLPGLPATTWLGSCRAVALNERQSSSSLVQVVGTCDVPGGTHAVRWDVTVASLPIFIGTGP